MINTPGKPLKDYSMKSIQEVGKKKLANAFLWIIQLAFNVLSNVMPAKLGFREKTIQL